ncbi:MAG: hypothetical protein U9R32_11240 [Bacteroidota bacterium]|nr:hypothetical protein [Bacteroidota bacterium]
MKSASLWIFTFIFTVSIAIYQKTTGPTYPIKGEKQFQAKVIKYKLPRSHGGEGNAKIAIPALRHNVTGKVLYKHYKSSEELTTIKMNLIEGELVAELPHQPPAGKLEYDVILSSNNKQIKLNDKKVVIRFKGGVPLTILIPHILLMFTAMLMSTRTGLEVIFKGSKGYTFSLITLITLFFGGLILGPIVQNYAFGAYWTGWPFGGDWTDNKTLFAFIFWLIAYFRLRKDRKNTTWAIIATVVLLAVYLIPHSTGGSELNHETGKIETGIKK